MVVEQVRSVTGVRLQSGVTYMVYSAR